jgi:hypothetical protein
MTIGTLALINVANASVLTHAAPVQTAHSFFSAQAVWSGESCPHFPHPAHNDDTVIPTTNATPHSFTILFIVFLPNLYFPE